LQDMLHVGLFLYGVHYYCLLSDFQEAIFCVAYDSMPKQIKEAAHFSESTVGEYSGVGAATVVLSQSMWLWGTRAPGRPVHYCGCCAIKRMDVNEELG